MPNKDVLLHEIDTLLPEYLGEIFDFVEYIKQKQLKKSPKPCF
jgi:hypothetical protein